jgi:hypothetical protein
MYRRRPTGRCTGGDQPADVPAEDALSGDMLSGMHLKEMYRQKMHRKRMMYCGIMHSMRLFTDMKKPGLLK